MSHERPGYQALIVMLKEQDRLMYSQIRSEGERAKQADKGTISAASALMEGLE